MSWNVGWRKSPFHVRWHRYGRSAGYGFWDIDSAVTHAADGNGRTACGIYVGKTVEERGPWEKAWDSAAVTCKRCKRSLKSVY